MEIISWGIHGGLQGRVQQLLNAVLIERAMRCWHLHQLISQKNNSDLSGGGDTERNRQRVDGSSTWLRFGASSTGGGGGWRRFRGL